MIWKNIVRHCGIASTSVGWTATSGFACKTVETVSDFATVVHSLVMDVRDSYRPELHYMRGPGPKWHAKHRLRLRVGSQAVVPVEQHQLSPLQADTAARRATADRIPLQGSIL